MRGCLERTGLNWGVSASDQGGTCLLRSGGRGRRARHPPLLRICIPQGKKARDGTISIDEMAGGTFTISNGGVYGSMLSTPIINPPQSAILGMHNITVRTRVAGSRPLTCLASDYMLMLPHGFTGAADGR